MRKSINKKHKQCLTLNKQQLGELKTLINRNELWIQVTKAVGEKMGAYLRNLCPGDLTMELDRIKDSKIVRSPDGVALYRLVNRDDYDYIVKYNGDRMHTSYANSFFRWGLGHEKIYWLN